MYIKQLVITKEKIYCEDNKGEENSETSKTIEEILDMIQNNAFDNNKIITYLKSLMKLNKENILLREVLRNSVIEYERCCYFSVKLLLRCALYISKNNIDEDINIVNLVVGIDDRIFEIVFIQDDKKTDIDIKWTGTSFINNLYLKYRRKYVSFDKSSILDLISAEVIEKDYYSMDKEKEITASILVEEHCRVIEHEVNEVIQILDYKDRPRHPLMWNKMRKYIEKHNICEENNLYFLLEQLQDIRDDADEGKVITKEMYKDFCIKKSGLLEEISKAKLILSGKKV